MSFSEFFNPLKSDELIGLDNYFNLFRDLLLKKKFPKITLLSGDKGIGKSTLTNHLMFYIFDNENYDHVLKKIKSKNSFFYQFLNNSFENIIYLNGSILNDIKINKIRDIKIQLSKTTINNNKRFIILDDIEKLNINSINALLKIIEEPSNNNYFVLINNKSKPLIETIKSRSLEFNIYIGENERKEIIKNLLDKYEQKPILDESIILVSPGNFLKFNYIFEKEEIDINEPYLENLTKFLNLYKKEKDIFYKDIMLYFSEYYLQVLKKKKKYNYNFIIKNRHFILKNINDFFLFNLSQNTLLNSIENKFLR